MFRSVVVSTFLALALVVGLSDDASAQRKQAPRVGQAAPDFTLTDVNGETVQLSDFKEKKNVLAVVHRGWVGYW